MSLPVPGVEVKLVPRNHKLEFHARGPNITPGYYRQPEISEKAFDAEGFFNFGDAVKFVDPDHPELGLAFNGRTAENFKLMTGTWVNVGKLRPEIISAGTPIIQDAVITGHDREELGLLVFPNIAGCRSVCEGDADNESVESLIRRPEVHKHLKTCMAVYNRKNSGSSKRISRLLLMTEPPSMDENESTEKGYINQRGVLDRRAALVKRFYSDAPAGDIILL